MRDPHQVLKSHWGFDEFRPLQLDIIRSVLAGRDTLALLPTGGGKSLCFQVPGLCLEGLTLVVSPLIALMKDQVQNLRRREVRAYAIYSGMSAGDIDRVLELCVQGQADFLYLSPERLGTDILQARLPQMPIKLLAIDEAHCISQWGYDFRPSYLKIAEVRALLPQVPLIALTATATPEVVEDMVEKLAFRPQSQRFQKSFARKNLAYVVLHEENKWSKLLDILRKVPGSGVVYVLNRKETKEVAFYLRQNGITAEHYHAGLESEQRSEIQDQWIKNKIRIIVATNAFGMGIDKPDVRVVVHLSLPESLEAYFQEAGRGGRDEQKAYGILLYNATDRQRLHKHYEVAFPPLSEVKQCYRALGSYYQLAIGAGQGQSFDFDLLTFSKNYNLDPLKAHSALKMLMQEGYIELSEAVFMPSTIQVICSREKLYDYRLRHNRMDALLNAILRVYQGVFNHPVHLREGHLAGLLRLSREQLLKQLALLAKDEIIAYRPQKELPQVTFLTERLEAEHLPLNLKRYNFLKERHEQRMQASLDYAESVRCRSQILLAYFGETQAPPCGQCDVCLGRHETELKPEMAENLRQRLQTRLSNQPLSLNELLQRYPSSWSLRLTALVEELLEAGELERDALGRLRWVEED